MEDAHEKAADVEIAATVKLRKIRPTTIAGVMAVTAYFAEHMDRFPGWIGGEIAYDDLVRRRSDPQLGFSAGEDQRRAVRLISAVTPQPAGPALGGFFVR
jgi:hypothetical protein